MGLQREALKEETSDMILEEQITDTIVDQRIAEAKVGEKHR